MSDPRRLLLALLALVAPLAPSPALQPLHAENPVEAARKGEALLERVAVIGASLSAGHGLGGDPGRPKATLTLASVIEAGLLGKHAPVLDASSLMTFIDPVGSTKSALSALEKGDPTLVVALDYLFWYGYGARWGGEQERLAALEQGLASLEGLRCPVLLGDFPDMRSALQAKRRVLPAQAVPDPETLAKLNQRLEAWAKQHANVVLVPVSKLMGSLLAQEELRVGSNLWRKEVVPGLLQDDGLHPTLEGATGLWLFAVERLLQARRDVPGKAFELDAGTLARKISPELKLLVVQEPKPERAGKSAPARAVH
jgi:hypothetical protein